MGHISSPLSNVTGEGVAEQWMVVDLKRFKPGKELEPGLLWVAEQIPGLVQAADLTDMLALSYWPSFNVPYFPEIYRCAQLLDLWIKRV